MMLAKGNLTRWNLIDAASSDCDSNEVDNAAQRDSDLKDVDDEAEVSTARRISRIRPVSIDLSSPSYSPRSSLSSPRSTRTASERSDGATSPIDNSFLSLSSGSSTVTPRSSNCGGSDWVSLELEYESPWARLYYTIPSPPPVPTPESSAYSEILDSFPHINERAARITTTESLTGYPAGVARVQRSQSVYVPSNENEEVHAWTTLSGIRKSVFFPLLGTKTSPATPKVKRSSLSSPPATITRFTNRFQRKRFSLGSPTTIMSASVQYQDIDPLAQNDSNYKAPPFPYDFGITRRGSGETAESSSDEPKAKARGGILNRVLGRTTSISTAVVAVNSNDSKLHQRRGSTASLKAAQNKTTTPPPPLPRSDSPKPSRQRRPASLHLPTSPKASQSTHEMPPALPDNRPPTTNTLSHEERSDLLRKNRKLQQVFGETSFGLMEDFAPGMGNSLERTRSNAAAMRRKPSTAGVFAFLALEDPSAPGQIITVPSKMYKRRHSSPFTPTMGGTSPFADTPPVPTPPTITHTPSIVDLSLGPASPEALIPQAPDPSLPEYRVSISSLNTISSANSTSATTPLLPDTPIPLSPSEKEIRARNRVKLAKLHRYLGSRVPPELVLGIQAQSHSEPTSSAGRPSSSEATGRPSSSGGRPPPGGRKLTVPPGRQDSKKDRTGPSRKSGEEDATGDLNRVDGQDSPLTDAEKAIFVKRKQKIEQVFGERPPQTLLRAHLGVPSDRPLTARGRPSYSSSFVQHRNSINSLTYLIQREDKEQLAELFAYVQEEDNGHISDTEVEALETSPVASTSSDAKSLRRHSLPPRSASIHSSIRDDGLTIPPSPTESVFTPTPAFTDFQHRRKRAAKLANFFGVGYRSLFGQVLDSIESGVQFDKDRGSLSPDEVNELMIKLRGLKAKRDELLFDN